MTIPVPGAVSCELVSRWREASVPLPVLRPAFAALSDDALGLEIPEPWPLDC